MQSPSPAQVVRQAPAPPQRYSPQLIGVCLQAPAPLQVPAGVNVDPVHVAVPQVVEVGAFWQAPAPLQVPVNPQGGAAVQRACGSASPAGIGAQVPSSPATLQAVQAPAHAAEAQQTPSTQELPL